MTFIETKPHIGRRIAAGCIDYAMIYLFFFIIIILLGELTSDGSYELNGAPALIPVGFWLLMTVGIEITVGVTIGNLLLGLRAIPINGEYRKLTFLELLKRHALDPVDMFFFGLIGYIVIKNTPYNQRVGDLWAKTIVVK